MIPSFYNHASLSNPASVSPGNHDTAAPLSSRGMILLTTLLTSCASSTTTAAVSPHLRFPQSPLLLDPEVSSVLMTEACVRFLQGKMETHDTKAYPCVLLEHLSWQSPLFSDMVALHLKHAYVH